MTSFTNEQRVVIKKLSYILSKSEQEIMNTPYEKLIRLLLDVIHNNKLENLIKK